jgi:hypothetical protein
MTIILSDDSHEDNRPAVRVLAWVEITPPTSLLDFFSQECLNDGQD